MKKKQQNKNEYLNKLLNKHESKMDKTQNYIKNVQKGYQNQIENGKYQIKQGSSVGKNKKKSPQKNQFSKINKTKQDLQNKLSYVDSRIGQITEPNSNSRIINQEQRRKFVTQMAKARKELEKKRQNQNKQIEVKNEDEKKKQRQENRKKQIQLLEKRRYQISKRSSEKEILKKKHEQQFEKQNTILKLKIKQKILSDKLNEKFKQTQANNLLERKKRLAQIRSLHKPLTKNEFEEHLQKIQELKNQRSKPESQLVTSRYMTPDNKKFYKSVWYEKQKSKKQEFEDKKHEEQLYQIKQMKDKLNKYSEYVRANFKPEANKKKIEELQQKSKSVVIPKKTQKQLRELGLKYLEYSKQQGDPSKAHEEGEEIRKAFRYMNYLQEIKKNKNQEGTKSAQDFVQSIKRKKNLSSSEKAQKILDYVENIERKAKMREEKGKASNTMVDEELDNLYMEAIEAKLSMLAKE